MTGMYNNSFIISYPKPSSIFLSSPTVEVNFNSSNARKWVEPCQSSTICDNASDSPERGGNPAPELQPTNYLRLYTVMIVSSMLVGGFQVLIAWASDRWGKVEKSEEEEQDSDDGFLEELLKDWLEDDED
jgi:hypothetical protein